MNISTMIGITGGSSLVSTCTDYIFHDEASVGYSISIVAGISTVAGSLILFNSLKYYRITVRYLDSLI
jgi:hypothetical protein